MHYKSGSVPRPISPFKFSRIQMYNKNIQIIFLFSLEYWTNISNRNQQVMENSCKPECFGWLSGQFKILGIPLEQKQKHNVISQE